MAVCCVHGLVHGPLNGGDVNVVQTSDDRRQSAQFRGGCREGRSSVCVFVDEVLRDDLRAINVGLRLQHGTQEANGCASGQCLRQYQPLATAD